MPSFKPKTNKNIKYNKKTSVTLDTKHKEYLNVFSKNENHIYDYRCEIYELKQKLVDKSNKLYIEEKLEINDRILELKELIKEMRFKKKDYLLGNSKYIFEYFENKKNISSGIKNETTTNKSKLVNNFF